ncbi:MAG TPA: hypothetical protein VLB27_07145 [candidate division Zixibacteria bacterium]|nr:hypothetical protein [candidate division Zixibacteria bacterium]
MTHVLMNTALMALLLILGAVGRNRANRHFGEKRAAGIRATRGIDVFAIVAALQLCESLAPPVMGSGVVGVIVVAFEGAGIILGIGLLLSGIVRWSPQTAQTETTPASRSTFSELSYPPGEMRHSSDRDALRTAATTGKATRLVVAAAEYSGARQVCALALPAQQGEPVVLDSLGMSPRELAEALQADDLLAPSRGENTVIARTESIDGVRFILYFAGFERAITERQVGDLNDALQMFALVCARDTQRRRACDARAVEHFALATSDLTAELMNQVDGGAPALIERIFTHLQKRLAPALAADAMILDWFSPAGGEARIFSLTHRTGAPAPARGFYPLTQRLPFHPAAETNTAIVRELPVFDSRPGAARLIQMGTREALTGFLRRPDGSPLAQVTFGASQSGIFGERERKLLAAALQLCAPLASLASRDTIAQTQTVEIADSAPRWGRLRARPVGIPAQDHDIVR